MSRNRERPLNRKLRCYAFDPALSLVIDTADINHIVHEVPWEHLEPGPSGEYIEVIDYDPTVEKFYTPVDLNEVRILADNGLPPSESNPQFHQQMVYAVAMITIRNFEKALGRKVLWAPREMSGSRNSEEYVRRLRIYPHALRDANAYYSPLKKAILFGYFTAAPSDRAKLMPGSLVFTCLSHDIIAHEVTHAILDGMHREYNRPTNPDVLALHEAFADIVALFQHFTFPEVLKHQISRTKGDLEKQNLLGQLAQEFGTAIGQYGSLRDALGKYDEEKKEWIPSKPDPLDYETVQTPHKRGSILVAAVFDAFLSIYRRRVADLLRIATGGSGILPEGELQPDLVNRLAAEAAKSAQHVLNMCIRAIDYCPPVDVTFGDYLRAIITADVDICSNDTQFYRLAFIEAFRRRGVFPERIRTLSEESLQYREVLEDLDRDTRRLFTIIGDYLRIYRSEITYKTNRKEIFDISQEFISGTENKEGLRSSLWDKFDNYYDFEKLTGLVFNRDWQAYGAKGNRRAQYEILNLRSVSRVGPNGDQINQIIFSLVQSVGVLWNNGQFKGTYIPVDGEEPPTGGFELWGGCTLIFDLDTVELKYAISKPLFNPDLLKKRDRQINVKRANKQFLYETEDLPLSISQVSQYFGSGYKSKLLEPFSLLHTG